MVRPIFRNIESKSEFRYILVREIIDAEENPVIPIPDYEETDNETIENLITADDELDADLANAIGRGMMIAFEDDDDSSGSEDNEGDANDHDLSSDEAEDGSQDEQPEGTASALEPLILRIPGIVKRL